MIVADCDIDNPESTCERCGWQAPDKHWRRNCPLAAPSLPGAQLTALLDKLGVKPLAMCQCRRRAALMNSWGVAKCRERREEIVGWLREGYDATSLTDMLTAAGKLVSTGLVLRINPLDPLGSLVDEALRRAEAG